MFPPKGVGMKHQQGLSFLRFRLMDGVTGVFYRLERYLKDKKAIY
jgi:hypothetical protein